MKRTIVVLLVLAMLAMLAMLVTPVSAAPDPQPRAIPSGLEYIDAQINVFLSHLYVYQADYLATHGQYYQSLASHSYAPDSLQAPDGLSTHPTYQNESLGALWSAAALPWELAWSFSVGTYDGPDGKGWVLNVQTVLNDHIYARTINAGPETYREADWYEVLPEEY